MAGVKNVWWRWYPCEYLVGVNTLTLQVQGAWMRLICHAQNNNDEPGKVLANLEWLAADMRVEVEDAWRIVSQLSLLKVGDVRVDAGSGLEALNESWTWEHRTEKPAPYWRVEVTCRRVVRDAQKRETELHRKNSQKWPKDIFRAEQAEDGPSSRQNKRKMGHLPRARENQNQNQIYPPTPLDGKTTENPSGKKGSGKKGGGRRKTGDRVAENTVLMVRLGRLFGRMPTTLWLVEEAQKLKALDPPEDEVQVIEEYYLSDHPEIAPWRRRSLVTLLNNWTRDLDQARSKLAQYGGRAPLPPRNDFAMV